MMLLIRYLNCLIDFVFQKFKDSERTIIGSQRVSAGFEIQISKASVFAGGTLYYTTDGSDPRVYLDSTGELTPTAQQYTSPIVINETTVVKARALDRGNWSALMEATFSVGSTSADMRITEVHYNAKGALGGSAAEFIELQNVSDTPIDLGKWSFQGIEFVFPWGTVVRPGARIVVASNDAPNIFQLPKDNYPMLDFSKIQIPKHLTQGSEKQSAGEGTSQQRQLPNEEDPAVIRDMLKANPDQMALLKQNNPRLAEALDSNNLEEFTKV